MKTEIYKEEGYRFMGATFEVYNEQGYGLSEEIYQESLEIELQMRGMAFHAKRELSCFYKGRELRKRYAPDLLVFGCLVIEGSLPIDIGGFADAIMNDRAHPLVHISFLVSSLPVLALVANDATPAAVLTVYACLGALPHANVSWTYGRVGRVVISPAYHRLHHAPTGRIDINLGTVLAIWDAASRRAVFPAPRAQAGPTGLSGRPVPVEQDPGRPGLTRTFLSQWAEPFVTAWPSAKTREVSNR